MLLAVAATAQPAMAQPATAQYGGYPQNSSGRSALVPSVAPVGMLDAGGVMPLGSPPAASARYTALDRVTAPVQAAGGETADPYAALTGQPATQQPPAAGLPAGSYPSPYYTDGPGCCGPLGRNGRVGYEFYSYVGPAFSFGEGRFARELNVGTMVGVGGRSLFFNTSHDAAWVVDFGLSYQKNPGERDHLTNLFVRQAPTTNPFTGETTPNPDIIAPTGIRSLHRTNFNFGVGRDWWLWGPGSTGMENGWNVRFGGLVGGRYGTAHVDLLVNGDPSLYQRKQGVTHGFFLAPHITAEVPMGTWILFAGVRLEYGYDWMNLVAPIQGNLHNLNLLFTAGIRF